MSTYKSFAAEVQQRSGQNIKPCYQCLKCSVGCTVAGHADYGPNAVIRMVQYGQKEKVLSSHMIWLCVSCMTCGVRCPNGIDLSSVMDTLREMSIEEGLAHEVERKVVILHEEFVRSIKFWGRLHEITFFVPHIARSMDVFSNLVSGIQLMARGKLPMIPKQIRSIEEIWDIYDETYKTKGQLAGREDE